MKHLIPFTIFTILLLATSVGCEDDPIGPGADDLANNDDRDRDADGTSDGDDQDDTGSPGLDSGPNNGTTDDATIDAEPDAVEDLGATISIYLAGDLEPITWTDGLSGQTPDNYFIALSAYQIQRSLDDPNPQPCFQHDAPREMNLHQDNLAGICATSDIADGLYTHGRVKVDWVRYTVDGTLHATGRAFPGKVTFFRAYSDAVYDGTTYPAGQGWIRYEGITEAQIPLPFEGFPQLPGVSLDTTNGAFWMTFPFTQPLPIVQDNTDAHWARLHWQIADAFRGQDLDTEGFTDGTWDLEPTPAGTEPVMGYGVSGYYVTTSID